MMADSRDGTNPQQQMRQALEVIQRAAKDEKEILENLVEDEFSDLKEVLQTRQTVIADKIQEQREKLIAAKDEGVEQAKRIANRVDHYVHSEPWWVLGVSAATALVAGYLLGRDRR